LALRAAQSSRSDDTDTLIRHRLNTYGQKIQDVLAYYSQAGILITVDGSGDVETVTSRLRNEIDQMLADRELSDAPASSANGSVTDK
jgi:adenylate kinase